MQLHRLRLMTAVVATGGGVAICDPSTTAVRFRIHNHHSYCHALCGVERRLFLGCDRFDRRADAILWPAKIVYPLTIALAPHTPHCRTGSPLQSKFAQKLEAKGRVTGNTEITRKRSSVRIAHHPTIEGSPRRSVLLRSTQPKCSVD